MTRIRAPRLIDALPCPWTVSLALRIMCSDAGAPATWLLPMSSRHPRGTSMRAPRSSRSRVPRRMMIRPPNRTLRYSERRREIPNTSLGIVNTERFYTGTFCD